MSEMFGGMYDPFSLNKVGPTREPGPLEGHDGISVLIHLWLLYEKHITRG